MSSSASPIEIVTKFNRSINNQDVAQLFGLMDENYTFIDTSNARIEGKEQGIKTWEGFFRQFPDYRNTLEKLEEHDGAVVIVGRSDCSFAPLRGPALWQVKTNGGKVLEWRVFDDTIANRRRLGI